MIPPFNLGWALCRSGEWQAALSATAAAAFILKGSAGVLTLLVV